MLVDLVQVQILELLANHVEGVLNQNEETKFSCTGSKMKLSCMHGEFY